MVREAYSLPFIHFKRTANEKKALNNAQAII